MKSAVIITFLLISSAIHAKNLPISLTYYLGTINSTDYKDFPLENITTIILFDSYDRIDYSLIPYFKSSGVENVHFMVSDGHRSGDETEMQKNMTIDRFKLKDPDYRKDKIKFYTDI